MVLGGWDAPSESECFVISTEKRITQEGWKEFFGAAWAAGGYNHQFRLVGYFVGKLALVGVPMTMNQSCYGLAWH